MKYVIDISEKEFSNDMSNQFQDFFKRVITEIEERLKSDDTLLCGNYELETAKMLSKSFKNAQLTQEPKTVLYSGDGYADGHMVYDMAECPNCRYEFEFGDKDWCENFCPHCGQPLKWESEEV